MIYAASNQELENFGGKAVDVIIAVCTKIFDGLFSVINALPPLVLGIIFGILLVVWLWHKVTS